MDQSKGDLRAWLGLDEENLKEGIRSPLTHYFTEQASNQAGRIYDIIIDTVKGIVVELALDQFHGNQLKAAKCLGIARNTLRTKMNEMNLL